MTDPESNGFYKQVQLLGLRPTNVPTVWIRPDGTFHNTRTTLRKLTREMADETLDYIRKSLSLHE